MVRRGRTLHEMPDSRTHRGPHPQDGQLFADEMLPKLRRAAGDLNWLLSRDYPLDSALKLVGDRFELVARQRTAVRRSCCSDRQLVLRQAKMIADDRVEYGEVLYIDGYNVLTTVEAALAEGVILAGRDGCYRDMASMHGNYRKVAETLPALELIGLTIAGQSFRECVWFLDSPVSNSGRLAGIIREVAAANDWTWRVELVTDPDPILSECRQAVATADSLILDNCRSWWNLAKKVIEDRVSSVFLVDLAENSIEDNEGNRGNPG
ncbi:MAG: DUF434 domain-containing protein [Pirellulales bacterium]|nr:DUF434 domain-containing protein [Pirellulales bacterium]